MSNNQWDDDDIQGDQGEGPKALRDALKKANKEKDELATRLASLESAQRERTVTDVLTSTGVNPAIAKFIPQDINDAPGVTAWLGENAALFGIGNNQPPQDAAPAETNPFTFTGTVTNPVVNAEAAQSLAAINAASTGGIPPTDIAQAMSQVQNVGSLEELNKLTGN